MKRLIFLFAILSLVLVSCEEGDVQEYRYESTTMMGKTTYTITQDSVVMNFNGRGEPRRTARKTESNEWSSLNKALGELDLAAIKDMEAPSNLRATDAAPFAKLYVKTAKEEFASKTFDGYKPHESLQPLMDAIKAIIDKDKKG